MTKLLTAPRTATKMNYRISLSGLLQLIDSYGSREVTPKSDGLTPDGFEYAAGSGYTVMVDLVQQAGYRSRHILKNRDLLIDAGGVMRVPTGKEVPEKKRSTKTIDKIPVPRANKLKTMNAPKMKALIMAMVNTLRHRFTKMPMHFFTVSFPPCIDVKTAKRYLNIWLTKLRADEKIFMYLWVMEWQKNGTAHFHLLIPGYLNVRYANRLMKETLVNAVKKREIEWTVLAAEKYNGVDIAKNKYTRKITNFADPAAGAALAKYVSKYITKNNAPTEYQRWHCSREWSGLCTGVALTENEARKFWAVVDHDDTIENEFFIFYRWKNGENCPVSIQKYLAAVNYGILNHYFLIDGNQVRQRAPVNVQNN
jgi:hypothetical protein